jgi:hypothetical protein
MFLPLLLLLCYCCLHAQTGKVRYPVKAINILKANGRSALESKLIKGYAINVARAAQGMPTRCGA